jgi:mannose-6-phosphate isomerase-like protein (cupin superfamily)
VRHALHLGAGCDGWHLVQQPGLSVIQERMPPGTAEVCHFHQHARQFFYVLSGAATLEVYGVRETLTAGQGLDIAPTVPHQIFNESVEAIEFLVISQPPSHGDRVVING